MKKCPYCAEEIQDEAIKCRHCCEKLVTATLGNPLPPLPPPSANHGWKLAVLVLALLLGFAWLKTPHAGQRGQGGAERQIVAVEVPPVGNRLETGTPRMTKAEWKRRIAPYDPRYSSVKVINVTPFKGIFGEPAQTQTMELTAYWYYECSDGTIQLVLLDPNATGGLMAIKEVNDF